MQKYLVAYSEGDGPKGVLYFVCMADNGPHALEQCLDAYPEVEVLAVYLCTKVDPAEFAV